MITNATSSIIEKKDIIHAGLNKMNKSLKLDNITYKMGNEI